MKTIDFRTKEQKREDRKKAVAEKWNGFAGWVRDNKDVLIIVGPVAVGGLAFATKVGGKALSNLKLNREIRFKQTTIYDHSLGRYVELKRPLTAAQSLTIEERRAAGEKLHVILNDMGLLR